MPLRSFRTSLWRKLYERFLIKGGLTGQFTSLETTVFPVLEVDKLIGTWKVVQSTYNIGAGSSGTVYGIVCPQSKRRRVYQMSFQRSSGDNLVSTVTYYDQSGGAVKLHQFASGGHLATDVVPIYQPLHMEYGDQIGITFDGTGASASVFTCNVNLIEEDTSED